MSVISVDTDTFLNITKRREKILYRSSVPATAANVAYVTTKELSTQNSISIVDRSTSLHANRVLDTDFITISNAKTFSISTENFLVTDVYATADSTVGTVPLFFKHTLSEVNVPRVSSASLTLASGVRLLEVDILDDLFSSLNVSAKSIDKTQGIIYTNLESSYIDSTDFQYYFVQYTVDNNGEIQTFVDLLSNEPTYHLATLSDLTSTMQLDPTKKAYLVEDVNDEFIVTLPALGTYSYKPIIESRLKILPPTTGGTDEPWYVRISDGKFFTKVDGLLKKYYIAEFLSQSFSPEPPIKQVASEISTVVNKTIIKLDRQSIVIDTDQDLELNVLISDIDDVALAAYTTDTTLEGTVASNGKTYIKWSAVNHTGIRSIDKKKGFVDIEGFDLVETYKIRSSYYYSEEEYEFTLVNLNPVLNRDIINQRLSVFVQPEGVSDTKTQTLFYLLSDPSGRVVKSNWSRFNNTSQLFDDGEQLYYEDFPVFFQTTASGQADFLSPNTHKFINEFSVEISGNSNDYLVLGDVSISEAASVDKLSIFDSRIRGGGIRDDLRDEAEEKDPDIIWFWDEGKWDGKAYPGNSSYYVEVPVDVLQNAGGEFTGDEVTDLVNRHTALGVYPVIKAYGVDVTVSGIKPGPTSINLGWTSNSFNNESIVYNVYYSTSQTGPWTIANTSPISHSTTGHSFTVTGLASNADYYVAVLGGLQTAGIFTSYMSQSIGPLERGVSTEIVPKFLAKTFAPHVVTTALLSHLFKVHELTGKPPTFHLFTENSFNGIDNLDPNLTISGVTVTPLFRYKLGDADAVDLPAWTYGKTMNAAGSGGTFNAGSPLLGPNDDSVAFADSRYYEAAANADHDVTTGDIVIELVFQYSTTNNDRIFGKYTGSNGYRIFSAGTNLTLTIGDGTGTPIVKTAVSSLKDKVWYHALIFINRDEPSTNGAQWYVNGESNGVGGDMSGASNTLASAVKARIAQAAPVSTRNWDESIAYIALWEQADWHKAGPDGPTEWATIAKERFHKLTGVYPYLASGTALASVAQRATSAYLDKREGSSSKLYYVGDNWMRMASRNDSAGTTVSGYLSETASTNLILQSEDVSTTWTQVTGTDTFSLDSTASPNKHITADGLIADNSTGNHGIQQSLTLSNATQYVFSVFAKAGDRDWIRLNDNNIASSTAFFDLLNGAVGTVGAGTDAAYIEDYGDGWFRCSIVITTTTTINPFRILTADADNDNTVLGDGITVNTYLWGAQVEQAEYPSSYIPTMTGPTIRNKDELRYVGDDGNLGGVGSELRGTIACNTLLSDHNALNSSSLVTLSDGGTLEDRVLLRISSGSDVAAVTIRATGGNDGDVTGTTDVYNNVEHQARVTWTTNEAKLYINGVSEGTPDTTVDIPDSLDRIDIGMNRSNADQPKGIISNLRIFDDIVVDG